jgi:sarcosine oxidase, subunit alpha
MTHQPRRLPKGGRIDRARPFRFAFDGRDLEGYAGDTLASALLANDVHLVGRSFKYHRPRGVFSAGAEEANALLQIGTGGRSEPNQKAPQIELYDGLFAESQNRLPSLRFDATAINDLLAPLLPAGFYYKTFMWPTGLWMRYERAIRAMAGMGRAAREADPDRYDQTNAHCDVLIAGGGPAGLMAALAAGRAGARVILADEQNEFGGRLLAESAEAESIGGKPAAEWAAETIAALRAMPEVRLLPRTTGFGYYDHNFLGLVERVTDHLGAAAPDHLPRQRMWRVRAKQVVLATGAIERPLVFADNDRPGIMLAGAARAYLNRHAVSAGERVLIFTNNDDAYRTALDLNAAGIVVPAVVDLRDDPQGPLPRRAREAGIEILASHGVVGTKGRLRVREARVAPLSGDTLAGPVRAIPCDAIAMSGGWNPAVHLFSQGRGKLRFEEARGIFLPGEAIQANRSAGACNGAFSLAACLAEGAEAGAQAAADAGFEAPALAPPQASEAEDAPMRVVWQVPSDRAPGKTRAFVDFQNDVTAKDVKLAAREGYRSVEHFKRYTTTGMGTDQGKTSNINGLAILAGALGEDIPAVGTTTFRPPYTPVAFGAFAGRELGEFYAPIRRTPIHAWHEGHGAVFEDVGQWKRPWHYPRDGEDMHAAVRREAVAARTGIGILDASTLGKIDIQGADAAALLNQVYTNAWSKLEVGRCRYGLMLGEDGMVMDDGVTARLAENRFLMSTTTGNAARVLAWLEECVQTEWPDMKVYMASATEQWATVSISGPRARDLLAEVTGDIDLSPEAFPFMSFREGTVAGIPARVFRISFTGELSFEINVAARHGLAVWAACMTAGEKYGITPFGTEAMHLLRAEKGFIIVGQDTDGTVTPSDLGMDWIVSGKKVDFLGKRSLARPDAVRAGRKRLVGLFTVDPTIVLDEGAQIVAEPRDRPPMKMIGHVTSSYFSPTLGRSIALALIEDGPDRMDQTLYAPMPDRTIPVRVTGPVFYDPDGERMRG